MKLKDEEIVELFFEVTKLNRRFSEVHYGNKDPFKGQYLCLFVLESAGTVNQKDLAGLMHIRPASVSEILLKLEQKSLVSRTQWEKDRRVSLVSLTEDGKRAVREARRERAKAHSDMLHELTQEEKENFYLALKKIKDHYIEMEER